MPDESEREKGFKVRDRRTTTGKEDKPAPSAAAGPAEKEAPEAAPSGTQPGEPPRRDRNAGGSVPKVDFSTFLLSLLTSALIQLGDMPDPITGKVQKDLASAKHTIDILDILKGKTKGNLTEEEDHLLCNATAELKWKYLDAIKKNG